MLVKSIYIYSLWAFGLKRSSCSNLVCPKCQINKTNSGIKKQKSEQENNCHMNAPQALMVTVVTHLNGEI